MAERKVTVRLRMLARDYVVGTTEAERMTRQLAAAQRDLSGTSRRMGDDLTRTSRQIELASRRIDESGQRAGRGLLMAAAGVAALGAAGGALKTLPGVLTATAAAGATLPPILMGAASAGGVLAASLRGVGDAIEEITKIDDPFDQLSDNALAFVAEVKALQPAWLALRQELQDRTFANAAANLRILGLEVLPRLRGSLGALADDWSDLWSQLTVAATDPKLLTAFRQAAAGADWFFDQVNARIPVTVRSFATLVTAADPLTRAFGQSIVNAVDKFNVAVERAAQTGRLADLFAEGAGAAKAFASIISNLVSILGTVTREVANQGGTLSRTANELERYVASGQAAADMAGIVRTLTTAWEGLRETLAPLGRILRTALADPATADAIATMFDLLKIGTQVLELLFNLFQSLPAPVRSLVMVMGALGLALNRVNKAFTTLQTAAIQASTSLSRVGSVSPRVSSGLQRVASAAGRAVGGLMLLQGATMVIDQLTNTAPDLEDLGRALEYYIETGKATGELNRLLERNVALVDKFDSQLRKTGISDLQRSFAFTIQLQGDKFGLDKYFGMQIQNLKGVQLVEQNIPFMKDLTEKIFGVSVTEAQKNVKALDDALADFARTTNNLTAVQDAYNMIAQKTGIRIDILTKLMPASAAELERLRHAAENGTLAMQAQSERARLLAGSFQQASLAGKDLAATLDLINGANINAIEGQIQLEAAYDNAQQVIDQYGQVVKRGTHEIDVSTEAGRAAMQALIGIANAAKVAADAEAKRTNNLSAGIPILQNARDRFIELAIQMTGSYEAAVKLANQIFALPDKDVRVDVDTELAIAKLRDLGYEIKQTPDGKWVIVDAKTEQARKKLNEAKALLDQINSKEVIVTVRKIEVLQPSGDYRVYDRTGRPTGTLTRNAEGGVWLPLMAAQRGLLYPNIYPPSNPPLFMFAEPETGGELFLPRRGIDRERGRALLAIAATWYDGLFIPMATGGVNLPGVVPAANGLVSLAPATFVSSTGAATRLDVAQAYLAARDAVARLTQSLKENGRAFSHATEKGRENRAAVYAAIQAAQEAARVKFAETGSVQAANKAYDDHINRLKAVLRQQKVNAQTINELMKLAERPVFAVADSSVNIAFAKADIAARSGLTELADALSLTRPGIDVATEHGRENLAAILTFLEQAAAAAQARFTQTGNLKTATSYYESLVTDMRRVLTAAGYSTSLIDSIINTYGRITIRRNARGGVYMPAAAGLVALRDAAIYQTGPLYGFAEKMTGGELFLPRHGDRVRGEQLLAIGAGWYGGRYIPARASTNTQPTVINNSVTVNDARPQFTINDLKVLLRQLEIEQRIGRP